MGLEGELLALPRAPGAMQPFTALGGDLWVWDVLLRLRDCLFRLSCARPGFGSSGSRISEFWAWFLYLGAEVFRPKCLDLGGWGFGP